MIFQTFKQFAEGEHRHFLSVGGRSRGHGRDRRRLQRGGCTGSGTPDPRQDRNLDPFRLWPASRARQPLSQPGQGALP